MNVIDRFTRDRISRFVWGLLTVACLATLVVVAGAGSRALTREIEAAEQRSASHISGVVAPMISWTPASGEIVFAYKDLYTVLQGAVFTDDPTTARVRLFDSEGVVLFASDEARRVGAVKVDDPDVSAAIGGETSSKTVTEPFTRSTAGEAGEPTELLQTYVPLFLPDRMAPAGAVQIDYYMDELRDNAAGPWPTLLWVFGALSGLCLIMTLLSLRPSTQLLGAGVRTLERVVGVREEPAGAAAPSGAAAPVRELRRATERTAELEREAGELREEVKASREQLKQAEEAHRYLEKRLRTTQDQLADYEGQDPAAVDERVASLEEALRKAEAEITLLRASRMDPDSQALLAQAEAKAEEAAARAAEIDGLRAELVQAEARLQAAEAAVATARAEAATGAPAVDPGILALLEERLETAEKRAEEAEQRLQAMSEPEEQMTAEASDLRARLARTAARKKLGADEATVAAHGASALATAAGRPEPALTDLQSAVASELRGPLNSILSLSLTLKNAVKSSEGKDLVRQLGLSARKLDQLVADLADAKKLAEGSLALNRRVTDLDALVARVVQEATGIENRDVAFNAENVAADVDPARIQQILDALLANAVERTTPGETIRVKLTASEEEATIAVEDDSPAAPEVGPDLVFAVKLAELHGGSIEASAREGGGAVFQVMLPLG